MKIQTIMDEIAPSVSKSTLARTSTQAFINKYSDMNTEDVDWEDICCDVETWGCYKYGFLLMVQLLRDRAYHGSHADKLYRNLPTYEKMLHQRNTLLTDAMCGGRIEQQAVYINEKPSSQQWFSFTYVDTTNSFIVDIFERHLNSTKAHGRWCPRAVAEVFGKSLGKYENEVHSVTDFKLDLPVSLDVLNDESVKWKAIDKQSDTKLPDIPEGYFNAILNKSLEVMRDSKANTDERMMGAAIVFISQTGLRLGDFLALTTDSLFNKTLAKSGNTTNYVHFTERKPSKAHQPLLEFDIFCNSLGTEAFNIMKTLRKKSALSKGNRILFVLSDKTNKGGRSDVPHDKSRFRNLYRRFLYWHLPTESTTEWEGISSFTYHSNPYGEKKGTASAVELYVPDTRQYRVHLCTVLYNQGVPLIYIQKYMGHLSDYMMGYYVRPKDTYQENIQYSEKVIREIAGEDVTPLGGNMLGEDIKENIKKFIADNGFNVQTDVEAIVKALGDKVIIRGKTGGVCIKTSLMPCSKDARTNEMMCAYNLCPNLFHFYYMVDVSYMNFQTLQDTYHAMKDSGKTKAAQKELSKMRDLLNRKLIPEMDELDKEIEARGFNTILDRHPSLLDIMTNRENIRKEIEVWRTKH